MNTTLTHPEASRARETAWQRFEAASADHNAWARTIAYYAAHGESTTPQSVDDYLIARAAEMEAHADWTESRERCAAVAS